MSLSIVQGTNDKPAASAALAGLLKPCDDLSGTLFIGYPIVPASDGARRIDALLVSRDHGLVAIDLVEGLDPDNYPARQDDAANAIDAKLRLVPSLTGRRDLLISIAALSFAPALTLPADSQAGDYPLTDPRTLLPTLRAIRWNEPDDKIYRYALSEIEDLSTIRRSSTPRTVTHDNSRGARLQRLEDSIATLDPTQNRAVIETVEGVQRIRGLAGSGKTIVLALKAAYLHVQQPTWRIAVTFHTRSLKEHFRRLINRFSISKTLAEPDWNRLRILNSWGAPGGTDRDGLYYEFCRTHGIDYFDFSSAKRRFGWNDAFRGACRHALRQSRKSRAARTVYDAILVDEAQDLPDEFLQICYELLDDRRRLFYAYDELQNLSGQSVSSPETLFGADADGVPRVRLGHGTTEPERHDLILEKCYRNSRPVLVAAHALGFGVYRTPTAANDAGLVQMFDEPRLWNDIGYKCLDGHLRDGEAVTLHRPYDPDLAFLEEHSTVDDLLQFVCVSSKSDQGEWVAAEIEKNLRDEDLNPNDIIVINPDPLTTRTEVGPVRSRLMDRGISSHVAGVDTDSDVFFRTDAGSVTFTGIHRAKGNEAGMVYVINGQDCLGDGRNVASIRNRLFAAMTRSKAWVRVIGVGDPMEALREEFERLRKEAFRLQFIYPTAQQRERMRVVHRDMTRQEQDLVRTRRNEFDNMLKAIDDGQFHIEDLDDEQLAKFRALLKG